jgi:antitoxin FitA
MYAGLGAFKEIGPIQVRWLTELGGHLLVTVESFRDRHAFLLAKMLGRIDAGAVVLPASPGFYGAGARASAAQLVMGETGGVPAAGWDRRRAGGAPGPVADGALHPGHAMMQSMAQLIVRNLDEALVARLRQRAAKHGRSTEAEHREILRAALLPARPRRSLKEHLLAMPDGGRDDDFARRPDRPRKAVRL